jgi:broad specificity phosphatase PhoE
MKLILKFIFISGLLTQILFTGCLNHPEKDWKPTRIFYVRHAQTVANATNNYTPITEATFSDSGSIQVLKIDSVLQRYTFDKIIVSPTWRTQHTIYPYLVATHQKAEIWSELTECCWQDDTLAPSTIRLDSIPWGKKILLMDTDYFQFKYPSANREYNWDAKNYQDGINQCRLAADSIRFKYGGKGLDILVIGHFIQGKEMIKVLTKGSIVNIPNATLGFYLIEQKDGNYKLQDIKTYKECPY